MANQKLTIYQRLGKLFGPAGPTAPKPSYQKFTVGPEQILKTTSKKLLKNVTKN